MKPVLKTISYLALVAVVAPSILVFTGTITLETHKMIMLGGTVAWFGTAPFWMKEK